MSTTFNEFNTELDSLLKNLNNRVKNSLNNNAEIKRSKITRMSNEEMIEYIEKYETMIFGNISYIKKDKICNKRGLEDYFYFLRNEYNFLFEKAEKAGCKSVNQNAFKYEGKSVYNIMDFIEDQVDCLLGEHNGLNKGLKGEKNLNKKNFENANIEPGKLEIKCNVSKVIEYITVLQVFEDYRESIIDLIKVKEENDRIAMEEARKAYQEKLREERQQEAERAKEKLERKKKIRNKLIAVFIVGLLIVKGVHSFNKFMDKRKAAQKVEALATSLNTDNISDIMVTPIEDYEKTAFVKLLKDDPSLIKDIKKAISSTNSGDVKISDSIIITKDNKIRFNRIPLNLNSSSKNYNLNINNNNGIHASTSMQLVPGIYELFAYNDAAQVKSEKQTIKLTKKADLKLELKSSSGKIAEDVVVKSNVNDGIVYINGGNSNIRLNKGVAIISPVVIGETKISVNFSLPWGETKSQEISASGKDITLNYSPSKDDTHIIEIIKLFNDTYKPEWAFIPIKVEYYLDTISFKEYNKNSFTINLSSEVISRIDGKEGNGKYHGYKGVYNNSIIYRNSKFESPHHEYNSAVKSLEGNNKVENYFVTDLSDINMPN